MNLNGAEFGVRDTFGHDATIPGVYGVDYIYPTVQEVDYFCSRGMNVFRLAFRWERLQPQLFGGLHEPEWERIATIISAAADRGSSVILNPHNFARYHAELIGSNAVPCSAFADFWRRVAERCLASSNVIFGLVNEPHHMRTEQWLSAANAAIEAIRGTGAAQLILVPGNGYTGAASWCGGWYGTPNARVMKKLIADADPFAFEVHQYFDGDGSGRSPEAVSRTIGSARSAPFTRWLRENGFRGFLGEFASGTDARSLAALEDLLLHVEANADVWLGWTYWSAGPWWGDYFFSLEPRPGYERPQMEVLQRHLAR